VFFWRKKFVKKATCKMIPRIYSSKTTRVFYITFESTRDAFRHSDESVMISNVGIHSKRNLEFSAEVSISSAVKLESPRVSIILTRKFFHI
jgi:hypothetical protein